MELLSYNNLTTTTLDFMQILMCIQVFMLWIHIPICLALILNQALCYYLYPELSSSMIISGCVLV